MADKAKDRWTVRGVPLATQRRASRAARAQDVTVGKWLVQAIEAALGGPTVGPSADLGRRLQDLEARLAKLERGEAVPVEDGGDAADAPEVMGADAPSDRQPRRRPWTAADDEALKRIAAAGGTQADAMRELQRSSGTINFKWQSLGLPVQPRKGRVHGPRQKLTA